MRFEEFVEELVLCKECEEKVRGKKQVYEKEGKKYIIYHEYNEFIERLLFRYKEQRDIALSSIFLTAYKKELEKISRKYAIVVLCSSEEKRRFRAFEPLVEWFKAIQIEVYSPFYKTMDWKQSSLSFEKRKGIHHILKKKSFYSLPKKPIVLFDDVITSGATIERAMELINVDIVIAYAAHPNWIDNMKNFQKSCEKM